MGVRAKLKNYVDSVIHNPSFTVKEQLGYAGGLFGNAMGQDCVLTYSAKFNRDFMGLQRDDAAGIRFDPNLVLGNASTILSFAVPPLAGAVVDRPPDRGRGGARPVLKAMPLPFAVASLFLFVVPPTGLLFRIIYTFLLTLLFNVADTFYDMALNAISIRMTTNPLDRKNFYTVAELAQTIGSMLPGWILPIIVEAMKTGDQQKWAYFIVALLFCIFGVSSMFAPYFTLKEKVYMRSYEKKNENMNLKALLCNRPLLVLLVANFFETIRRVTYQYLPYLYDNTLGQYGMKAIVDTISGALSYAGLFLVPMVGRKVSSRDMMISGYAYTGLFYTVLSLFNIGFSVSKIRKYKWIVGVIIGLAGMPNAAMSAARRIIIADSTDYMEWKTYQKYGIAVRSEGMVLAATSIVSKASSLLQTNLSNGTLNAIGYKSGYTDASGKAVKVQQSDETLQGIYLVMTLCGLLGNLLPCITYFFNNFTGKRRDKCLDELREIRLQNVNAES